MRLSKVPKRFRHIRFFAVAQNDRETTCAHENATHGVG